MLDPLRQPCSLQDETPALQGVAARPSPHPPLVSPSSPACSAVNHSHRTRALWGQFSRVKTEAPDDEQTVNHEPPVSPSLLCHLHHNVSSPAISVLQMLGGIEHCKQNMKTQRMATSLPGVIVLEDPSATRSPSPQPAISQPAPACCSLQRALDLPYGVTELPCASPRPLQHAKLWLGCIGIFG